MRCLNDLKFLNEVRERSECCNAEIVSRDGMSFPVHSQVLMANSVYFWSAFQFGPGEGLRGPERTIITIPYVDSTILASVISYMYIAEIRLDKSNVWSILRAADYLQMNNLTKECLVFLKQNMCASTCINLRRLVQEELYLPEVDYLSQEYVFQNLCEPRRSVDVRRSLVSHVNLEDLLLFLDSDMLNAPYEQLVWENIVAWITHDPDNRKQHLKKLLTTIRIGQLSEQFFRDTILRHPALLSDPEAFCDLTARENKLNYWLRNASADCITRDLTPRLPNELVIAFGGWRVGSGPSKQILVYDIQADSWTKVHAKGRVEPLGLAFHGLARVDNYVYVIGGSERDYDTDHQEAGTTAVDTARCYRFNLNTLEWESLPPLSIQRNYVSCGVVDGLVYAIGGRDVHHNDNIPRPRLDSVEVFYPSTHQWSPMPSMNHKRSDAGIAIIDKKIYMLGGNSGFEILSSVECFDTRTREWTMLPSMIAPRVSFKCVVLHGHIYVLGGRSRDQNTPSVLRFNPCDGTWQEMAPMRVARSVFAAVVIRDTILVAGGHSGSINSYVELYHAFENKWYPLSPLLSPRSGVSALVIEGDSELRSRVLSSQRATLTLAGRHVRRGPLPSEESQNLPQGNQIILHGNPQVEPADDVLEAIPWTWLFAPVVMVNNNPPQNEQVEWSDEDDEGDEEWQIDQTD